jgi:type I restriction enzyme S subunit
MKRIRLGNYCKITAGGDKPKVFSIIKNDECFVPVYSNGIENNGLVGYTNKATISEESVTVAARGSCGYAFFRDTPYVPIIRLISIIPFDDNVLDTKYLYYLLKLLPYQGIGSVQSQITVPQISDYSIDFIDDNIKQKKIAKTLSLLDYKIENNNKINAELESMAKTLYDYWFLQFEFPNKEGKPYRTSGGKMVWNEELKREIPEGWEVRTVKDCADVVSGYPFKTETYSKDGKYKIYTIGNVQDGYIDDTCPNKIDFIPDDMDRGCILKPCDIIMSLTGNVGRVGLVYTKNALLNQRVLKVEPLEGYHNFLYLLFRNSSFSRVMQRIASGTSQKNLSPNQVCDFKFAIPKKSLLDLFNKKVNGFIKAIVNNLSQNQELTSLRDFLLPLLMNGQVKFKD